jgi:hypothetical protein
MKKPSENYKMVSCIVVIGLFAIYVLLMVGNLSHAFNTSPVSPDEAYVIGIDHSGADQ